MFPIRDTIRSSSFPAVNWLIIIANALVFLFQRSLGLQDLEMVINIFGVVPVRFLTASPLAPISLVSSQFLHGGWLHLIANLWTLYIFGDNVEDRMGHLRYLIFYLLSGVLGGVVQVLSGPTSPVPTIGASGSIAGVLGAYVLLFPRARVLTFVPIFFFPWMVEIPAVIYLGVWFASQFFSGMSALGTSSMIGGVAYWAHVGGFASGLLLVRRFALRPHVTYARRREGDNRYRAR